VALARSFADPGTDIDIDRREVNLGIDSDRKYID